MSSSSALTVLGWDAGHALHFQPYLELGLQPARVFCAHRQACEISLGAEPLPATCTGRLLHDAPSPADLPAVGDWVAVRLRPGETRADIHAVLPRRTKFARRAAGSACEEQVIATNLDTVFLVTALDQNYNLRRIERYLALAWESGAQPVIVLNKADLHAAPGSLRSEVAALAAGAPVVGLSATHDDCFSILAPWLQPHTTVALLGSSGVGKSTLINRLLGNDRQDTGDLSTAVGKGRHTTTRRELFATPDGVLIIDTPGMRELQLWDVAASAVQETFADIAALAARCRFGDCAHAAEPGCAVQAALADGELEPARWQSYQKLLREQAYAARQADPKLARAHRAAWRKVHLTNRARDRREED
jgi:ribosome biogenesis GTPase